MARSNLEMLALAVGDVSPKWSDRVPEMSRANWDNVRLLLSSDNFAPARNEIFEALINRIGMTVVHDLNTNNPLSVFRDAEGLLFGDTVQEMGTDIIKAERFQGVDKPQDQFAPKLPDVTAVYHRINREDQYRTTTSDPRLRRAFVEEGALSRLVAQFIDVMYKSNTADEYIYAKRAFSDIFTGNNVDDALKLQPTQIMSIPDITSESASVEDIRKAITRIKNAVSLMGQNTDKFNQMKRTISTPKSDLVAVLNLRAVNQNEVQNLSGLFNPEYNALGVPVTEVDDFGEGADNLIGVVCHRRFLQIRDNMESFTTADNARSLYRNYFYTVFQQYMISPYYPAIFLSKS